MRRAAATYGLSEDDIVIRMTGCPNGCARPYLAEIGLVGKGPGRYNLYLGAAFDGSRVAKLYAEVWNTTELLPRSIRCLPLMPRSATAANAATLSFAPALWRRPEMAGISMRIRAQRAE